MNLFTGEAASPEFLAKNPMGSVLMRETDSGECLPESNAILTFLAEGTPELPREAMACRSSGEGYLISTYHIRSRLRRDYRRKHGALQYSLGSPSMSGLTHPIADS